MFELADEIGREHVRALRALERATSVNEHTSTDSTSDVGRVLCVVGDVKESNPRWVAKPTVAYLWARTVPCAGCRQDVPLLKTRWLCKRGGARGVRPAQETSGKRVRLKMRAGANGVVFGVKSGVPVGNGSAARRRERDRVLGAGTMSSSGVTCPCCGVTATMADLRAAAAPNAWVSA